MKQRLTQINTVYIVAGGNLSEKLIPKVGKYDELIGVDYGAFWLLKKGIVPRVAIGDFDSVSAKEFKKIQTSISEVFVHKSEKDDSDLALAVAYAKKKKPKKIVILGAVGTRMDHTWVAIQLLQTIVSHNIDGEIVDNFNKIYIVRRQKVISQDSQLRYVSIMPLTQRATVTLKGLKYNVSRRKFEKHSTLGVSNEIVKKLAKIDVHAGSVLVIQSRD